MRNTVVYASLVTSFLWLLVGIALIALGWRVATVPGAGWCGPRSWVERLAQTSLGRFISAGVGVGFMLAGVLTIVVAMVAAVTRIVS